VLSRPVSLWRMRCLIFGTRSRRRYDEDGFRYRGQFIGDAQGVIASYHRAAVYPVARAIFTSKYNAGEAVLTTQLFFQGARNQA